MEEKIPCPSVLNPIFFEKLEKRDQLSCIKLFSQTQNLTHSEIFQKIIKFCIQPYKNDIKLHLFGLFVDLPNSVIAYYPPTFFQIIETFLKKNQTINGTKRFISSEFREVSNAYHLKFDDFSKFLISGQKVCICDQTTSQVHNWIFKYFKQNIWKQHFQSENRQNLYNSQKLHQNAKTINEPFLCHSLFVFNINGNYQKDLKSLKNENDQNDQNEEKDQKDENTYSSFFSSENDEIKHSIDLNDDYQKDGNTHSSFFSSESDEVKHSIELNDDYQKDENQKPYEKKNIINSFTSQVNPRKTGNSGFIAYQLQPTDRDLKDSIVHVSLKKNSHFDDVSISKAHEIADIAKNSNFDIFMFATDADTKTNKMQKTGI